MIDDTCDVCDGTGRVQDEPTARQRSIAKRFGWDCPDFFDRPCSLCRSMPLSMHDMSRWGSTVADEYARGLLDKWELIEEDGLTDGRYRYALVDVSTPPSGDAVEVIEVWDPVIDPKREHLVHVEVDSGETWWPA